MLTSRGATRARARAECSVRPESGPAPDASDADSIRVSGSNPGIRGRTVPDTPDAPDTRLQIVSGSAELPLEVRPPVQDRHDLVGLLSRQGEHHAVDLEILAELQP